MKKFVTFMSALLLSSAVVSPLSMVAHAEEELKFETHTSNSQEAIKGGTLRIALSESFAGLLNPILADNAVDSSILGYMFPPLIGYNNDFEIDDSGLAQIDFDKENQIVTMTLPADVKWEDGEPLTVDDIIFTYECVGNKDYTGPRYGTAFQSVKGMKEFHDGDTDTISGLEKVDDQTLKIHYDVFTPSLMQAGGALNSYVIPKHIFKDIPVKDFQDSEYTRVKPVGFGPYKIESIVPGESVTFVANDLYYKGRPKIDKLVLEVVNSASLAAEMAAGRYDIASMPADQYEEFQKLDNVELLGDITNVFSYTGFKLGKWDDEKKEVQPDDSLIVADKAIRQAMGYAVDNAAVGEKFYHGLRFPAKTLITPNFTSYIDESIDGYIYNPEKAREILKNAGYEDKDGDGFIEDKNGQPFSLKVAAMSGSEIAEPLTQYYLDSWKAVGINCELTDGRLMDMNTFYDRVQKDDPDIQVYIGAWVLGGDPNPTGFYGRDQVFNLCRFATEEHDKLLAAINSNDTFDPEVKKKAFDDWQKYMNEEVPVIPTLARYALTVVNKRVKNYNIETATHSDIKDVELTAENPIEN